MKYCLLALLLFGVTDLPAVDILRSKAGSTTAPATIIHVFTQIDSVRGHILYGKRIMSPDTLCRRDTLEWAVSVNWNLSDTLLNVNLIWDWCLPLDYEMKYIAGELWPAGHEVDSLEMQADSTWRAGR
ncbi:MAG: hypothetical protein V1794_15860 [Candidatus Glassbacteria bacterium]